MSIFILGSDAIDDVTVGEIYALGNIVSVNEDTHVFTIYISDFFEELAYIIGHGSGSFWFVLNLNQVSIFLGCAYL